MTNFFRDHARTITLGVLGAGTALALTVPSTADAAPTNPDLSGLLSNSSSDLPFAALIPEIIERIPELIGQAPTPAPDGKTHCRSVMLVGDSTSTTADEAASLPSADDTASAQYGRVGVENVTVDAESGRAIVGGPGVDGESAVAKHLAAAGDACWVIALGVNDAGALAGGGTSADERIDRIMTQLKGRPVLWPTVATSDPSNSAFGPEATRAFNDALRRATDRYDNLAVYDWTTAARPEMFGGDGVHYTAAGYAARNKHFADALAIAYPTGGGAKPSATWIG